MARRRAATGSWTSRCWWLAALNGPSCRCRLSAEVPSDGAGAGAVSCAYRPRWRRRHPPPRCFLTSTPSSRCVLSRSRRRACSCCRPTRRNRSYSTFECRLLACARSRCGLPDGSAACQNCHGCGSRARCSRRPFGTGRVFRRYSDGAVCVECSSASAV